MANEGKAFGEPAKRYAMRIAVESSTGRKIDTYMNANMERGKELEDIARSLYIEQSGIKVGNGGFAEFGNYGASSDGLVDLLDGSNGMIEIKSVLYNTQFNNMKKGYDASYKWQIQGNLWIYDRQWCDFVSYCPDFPEGKQLHTCQVDRDEGMIKRLEKRLGEFWKLVEEYKEVLK
jgi:hypothetical protein